MKKLIIILSMLMIIGAASNGLAKTNNINDLTKILIGKWVVLIENSYCEYTFYKHKNILYLKKFHYINTTSTTITKLSSVQVTSNGDAIFIHLKRVYVKFGDTKEYFNDIKSTPLELVFINNDKIIVINKHNIGEVIIKK